MSSPTRHRAIVRVAPYICGHVVAAARRLPSEHADAVESSERKEDMESIVWAAQSMEEHERAADRYAAGI